VRVLGEDPARAGSAWRDRIGVVLQDSAPEPGLTVRECLHLYAGYYSTPRDVEETIALVGLQQRADAMGTELSGGQRRRLDVALALIGDPDLIFLDEPTTGFDPSARRAAWDVVDGLRHLGKTIFLTTHFMDEAEALADRIAVLSAGQIVAEGTAATLGGRDHLATTIRFTLPKDAATSLPKGLRPLLEKGPNRTTIIRSESPLVHLQMLSHWGLQHGLDLSDIDVRRPSLEDVYLSLTQPKAKEKR
jgi:ABC-2 type transport system ATP-binding protein